jgi:polyhydroxyalkanoate synthesis regulator phasin
MAKLREIMDQYNKIIDELVESADMSVETAYTIAVKLQENLLRAEYNEFYAAANVVNTLAPCPSALEKIAMELEKFNDNN